MNINNKIIDIIYPSNPIVETEFNIIKQYLSKIDFELNFSLETTANHIENPKTHSILQRFNNLKNAIENNKSQIIWCGKGGFGSGDLLPLLLKINFPKNQKTIIGFSDATSIFTYFQHNLGYQVIYAPDLSLLSQGKITNQAQQQLLNLINNKSQNITFELQSITNHNQEIYGELAGGCLSVFASQLGGVSNINLKDKILFLEDEGESSGRLSRYFRQILEFIIAHQQKPKAILLGNFLQKTSFYTPSKTTTQQAISSLLEKNLSYELNIPIFIEKHQKLGHGENMHPIILGANARIYNNSITILC